MQAPLDFTPALQPSFDSGIPLTPADQIRLTGQIARVLAVLQDAKGEWLTVQEITERIKRDFGICDPETSVSAQARNLRKRRMGGYKVPLLRTGNICKYRLEA